MIENFSGKLKYRGQDTFTLFKFFPVCAPLSYPKTLGHTQVNGHRSQALLLTFGDIPAMDIPDLTNLLLWTTKSEIWVKLSDLKQALLWEAPLCCILVFAFRRSLRASQSSPSLGLIPIS
ncbi:hypothetical protein Tco_0363299 [Tanacetum coccineum]